MVTEAKLERLADEVRTYDQLAADSRAERDEAIREALAAGMSAYRVSQVTGIDQKRVGKIRDK